LLGIFSLHLDYCRPSSDNALTTVSRHASKQVCRLRVLHGGDDLVVDSLSCVSENEEGGHEQKKISVILVIATKTVRLG